MNPARTGVLTAERKLALAAVVVAGVTAAAAFVGGLSTWQYYLTVDECLSDGPALSGKRVRVNGTVAPASLRVAEGRASAAFRLEGARADLNVDCPGPMSLPDNLAEGIQVVVEGELRTDGRLRGERVLTRCASKYRAETAGAAVAQAPSGPGTDRGRVR